MKKFLIFVLTATLLICISSGIHAEEIKADYEVKTIEIDLSIVDDIENLSDIEIGKMKLKKAGYSDKLINMMSERMLLKAKNAITLYRTIKYPASDDSQAETTNEENKKTKNLDKEIAELLSQIKIIENNESNIEINK